MSPPAATQKKDDYDMGKLQKSLQQQRRHSQNNRAHVAKLTPAEIRSLNNSATASNQEAHRLSVNSRRSNSTPPGTPSHHHQSAYQAQVSRSSSINNLPTPPHSPNIQHRRESHSSVQNAEHRHGSHIYAPIPKSTAQAGFMIHGHSRPSRPASFQNLPMYRGHEVTRTGSMNMLQRPAKEIVTNPLSMYSRPRQSLVHASPDKQRPEDSFPEMDVYQAQAMLDANEDEHVSKGSSRESPPPNVVESPVSFDEKQPESDKIPVEIPEGEVPRLVHVNKEPSPVQHVNKDITALPHDSYQVGSGTVKNHEVIEPKSAIQLEEKAIVEQTKKNRKRFSFFEPKNKDASILKKKDRRQTVGFTKSTGQSDQSTAEKAQQHEEKDLLLNDSDAEFPANPAVRPLSRDQDRPFSHQPSPRSMSSDDINTNIVNSTVNKGKMPLAPLSIPSRPVYPRCACCGKIKRPKHASELSPVFENENLRTNFNIEADRTRSPSNRMSNDRKRFTPIIPMEIREGDAETGSIRTVNASIAPYDPSVRSASRQSGSDASFMSGGIGHDKRRRSDSASEAAKVTRFSSLHGKKALDIAQSNEDEVIEDSTPVVERNGVVERAPIDPPHAQTESGLSSARPPSQLSRPMSYVPADDFITASGPSSKRSSMPKQDVIDVVGWDNGKRVEEVKPIAETKQITPEKKAKKPVEKKSSPTTEPTVRTTEDKRKSRVSGILKALQPRPKSIARTQSDEDLSVSRKRMSRPMSQTEDALNLILPNIAVDKENRPPIRRTPSQDAKTRFSQYSVQETKKKGHAPQLSLHLDGEGDGLMTLPEPNMGIHFARSSMTLRDFIMPNGTKTPEMPSLDHEMVNGSALSLTTPPSSKNGTLNSTPPAQSNGILSSNVGNAMKASESSTPISLDVPTHSRTLTPASSAPMLSSETSDSSNVKSHRVNVSESGELFKAIGDRSRVDEYTEKEKEYLAEWEARQEKMKKKNMATMPKSWTGAVGSNGFEKYESGARGKGVKRMSLKEALG